MNLFILEDNPEACAISLCDTHVNKMFTETCQMLSNCFFNDLLIKAPKTKSGSVRKHSHWNHPCSKWVRESLGNFTWTLKLALSMKQERYFRGMNPHFSEEFLYWAMNTTPDKLTTNSILMTPFVMVMPDRYITYDVIASYRTFYIQDKKFDKNGKFMLKYSVREAPVWLQPYLIEVRF